MSVHANAKAFWERFQDEQPFLEKDLVQSDYDDLTERLEGLRTEVMAISGCQFFVEDAADQFEMTFDPGPNKTSQYLADYIVKLAPAEVKEKWIINASLPPLSQKAIEAQVQIKDDTYTLVDFHVFYTIQKDSQTLDCLVYCPGYRLINNEENKKEMSMYLLELAIGQTLYEAYISSVGYVDQPPEEKMDFCNLADFYEAVVTIAEKEHWKEYKSPLDIYTVYQPYEDFANDALRKDMKIIFTTHPLLTEETLGNTKDVLLDLKAKDGEFGYIYYANPFQGKDDAIFRQELSRQLDKTMTGLHAGKVIGGAIGKSWSYIDWIIYDPQAFRQAFEQLKRQLDPKVELHYRTFEDGIKQA